MSETHRDLLRERVRALAPSDSAAVSSAASGDDLALAEARRFLAFAFARKEAVVPDGARFAGLKRLVLRAARLVTRSQTEHNAAVVETLERVLRQLADESSRRRGIEERVDSEARARSEQAEGLAADARRISESLSALAEQVEAVRAGAARRADDDLAEWARRADELALHARQIEAALADEQAARDELSRAFGAARDRLAAWDVDGLRNPDLKREIERLRAAQAMEREIGARPIERREGAPLPRAPLADLTYFDFEDRCRGPEAMIRERQRMYLPFLSGLAAVERGVGPVLDLGCGRGELLELLHEAKITARGIDANAAMVVRCRQKQLDVSEADLFEHLAALPAASLAAVCAAQVIEHLGMDAVVELLRQVRRVVAPGGGLILETINPESVYAMRYFWHDPTHVRPVPAATLEMLTRGAGFGEVDVRTFSPVPAELRVLPGGGPSLDRLDATVFGDQDYALFARVLA